MTSSPQRVILHVDMDAYYASIEQRDAPELRGKPVIVGGTSRRGVVSTCSYEARRFGVRSAMPSWEARRLCPDGIFVPPRFDVYTAVSAQIMAIFDDFSPHVEPLSLDEAFVDMTGAERLFGTPLQIAQAIQGRIAAETGLTASIGCASNKFVAKIASELNKPNGITCCEPGHERAFLAPLSLRRLWGVGPKSAAALEAFGLATIGDIARMSQWRMHDAFGNFGDHVWNLAHGLDDRPVAAREGRSSLAHEVTLDHNIVGADAVLEVLGTLVDTVARGLRAGSLRAGGVRLKVRYADFKLTTRDLRVAQPICDSRSLLEAATELTRRVELNQPIRLVGLAAYELGPADAVVSPQIGLFEQTKLRNEQVETAWDVVNRRFGDTALRRGSTLAERSFTTSDNVADPKPARGKG